MSKPALNETATLEVLSEVNHSLRREAIELLLSIAALKDQLVKTNGRSHAAAQPSLTAGAGQIFLEELRDTQSQNAKRKSRRPSRPR
jgi:hypothetical protein